MKKAVAFLMAFLLLFGTACGKQKDPHEERMEKISHAISAQLEAAEQEETVRVDGRAISTFVSIRIVPTEGTFEESWLYRFTVYPPAKDEEIIILFGETCLSVDGVVYVAEADVNYANVLEWAKGKYEHFVKAAK